MKVFIDTCIPMYAAGSEHPMKVGCLDILEAISWGRIEAITDSEVFQEILYRYFSINRRQTGLKVFDLFSEIMQGRVLSVRHEDVIMARKLAQENSHSHLSPRDLIHLAVMMNNGIQRIITASTGFANVPGIQVIYPTG